MLRIIIELPTDRNYCGSLLVLAPNGQPAAGPFTIAGRSSDSLARSAGNAARIPTTRYGDTPAGRYRVARIVPTGDHTSFAADQFGANGLLVLEAVDGDAALADANGRFRLFVQAGALAPNGALRSTAGALRLSDADMAQFMGAIGKNTDLHVDVIAQADAHRRGRVFDDSDCSDEDPPSLSGPGSLVNELARDISRRTALRAGALGAGSLSALSLSVSFIALGSPTTARASGVRLAYGDNAETPSGGGSSEGGGSSGGGGSSEGGSGGGAMQQLENGTSGSQDTGTTFDNGHGPSDATPNGGTEAPPEPPAPPETTEPPPTTEAPPETTETPPETTEAPPETTQTPPETTETPPETTEPPPVTTEPPPITEAPPETPGPTPPETTEPTPEPTEQPPVPYQGGSSSSSSGGNNTTTTTTIINNNSSTTNNNVGGTPITGEGGQPIGGIGVHQGPPDKAPPPNPTPSTPQYRPIYTTPTYSTSTPSSPSYTPPAPKAPTHATLPPRTITPGRPHAPPASSPPPTSPPPPPAPTTAPSTTRKSTTVIDIFPAGSTPTPGQKPPGK